jgi:hypothetical protein
MTTLKEDGSLSQNKTLGSGGITSNYFKLLRSDCFINDPGKSGDKKQQQKQAIF